MSNTEDEFDAKFGKEFGVKFGVKFGVNERKVLLLLASNPSLSAGDIAAQIGLSTCGIEKQLKKFRDLGEFLFHIPDATIGSIAQDIQKISIKVDFLAKLFGGINFYVYFCSRIRK